MRTLSEPLMCGLIFISSLSGWRWMFWPMPPRLDVPVPPAVPRPMPANDEPLYGMLVPTEMTASSLSIAMMCGDDKMLVLPLVASAWKSTPYDGIDAPSSVVELGSGAPMRPPMRPVALINDDRLSELSDPVCTPPSARSVPLTGMPPCELTPPWKSCDNWISRMTPSMST